MRHSAASRSSSAHSAWRNSPGLTNTNGANLSAANVVGWLVAFCVSFAGHYRLTFRHQRAPLLRAAGRFFMVSALGFAINEAAYAALLRLTTIRYDVLLALVLVGIAGMTFILGRYWAFRHSH